MDKDQTNGKGRPPLMVGIGVQDFTPDPPENGSFRVFDSICFSAMVIRNGETSVTLLAGDFFSIEDGLLTLVKERLADIAWLESNHILACAAHIGTAPILYQSYVRQSCEALRYFGRESFIAEQMASAIRKAAENMKPARIGLGASLVPGVLYNRRSYDREGKLVMSNFLFPYPRPELTYQEADENAYVLRVDDSSGTPRACAFIFGCHALCSTDRNGNISADYPGVVRKVLRSAGIEGLFLPGSIGNVVPLSRGGRTFERVGNSVAGAVLYALEQIETRSDTFFDVLRTSVSVPLFDHASLQPEADIAACTSPASDGLHRFHTYGKRLQATHSGRFAYAMTRIVVGEAELLHMPGEIFVETAKAIKDAAADRLLAVISGPSADIGYLSTPRAHDEGGMEPLYAGLAREAEQTIREAACRWVARPRSAVSRDRI